MGKILKMTSFLNVTANELLLSRKSIIPVQSNGYFLDWYSSRFCAKNEANLDIYTTSANLPDVFGKQ